MPRLAANLSMLYPELPFMQRFSAAGQAGFGAVEFQFPYEYGARDILAQLQEHDLDLVLFNLPAGDWAAGDRGIAAVYDRREEFVAGLGIAEQYIDILRPRMVNLLAGASEPTDKNDLALLQSVRIAAEILEEEDTDLVIEPVNTTDVPNFAVPTARAAIDLIEEIDRERIRLQLDVYHAVMMGDDPISIVREHDDVIGHIQIADVPGRHQPGTGTIDWEALFRAIDDSDYDGVISLEYIPEGPTNESFAYLRSLGVLD